MEIAGREYQITVGRYTDFDGLVMQMDDRSAAPDSDLPDTAFVRELLKLGPIPWGGKPILFAWWSYEDDTITIHVDKDGVPFEVMAFFVEQVRVWRKGEWANPWLKGG